MRRHLDAFHAHEALHVSNLIARLFERELADHPYIRADERLRERADRISAELHALYQAVGSSIDD